MVSTDDTQSLSAAPAFTSQNSPESPARLPNIGDVLKDRYRLDSKIGEGGMGVVFKVTDLGMQASSVPKAVKLLQPSLSTPSTRLALQNEVELVRDKLKYHENVVNVYNYEQEGALAFILMEYLVGRSLDRIIDDGNAGGMSFDKAWLIIEGMARGLIAAHSCNVIHSDFKPSNVFVTPDGTKVLDFGIARATGTPLKGMTINYASCEMLEGGQYPDARDDVYGFGLVVYKLLTGKHPFLDEDGFEVRATVARDNGMTVRPIKGLSRRQNNALKGALKFERKERTNAIQAVFDELRRRGPSVGPILAGVAAIAIVTSLLFSNRFRTPMDNDEDFLNSMIMSTESPTMDLSKEEIADLLTVGKEAFDRGLNPFDPMILSENSVPLSTALLDFQQVRRGEPRNVTAAHAILAIAKAYKSEAQRLLDAGRLADADRMVKDGLQIWPDSIDLRRLEQKTRSQKDARANDEK